MTQYTKAQVEKIIDALEERKSAASDKAYDKLDRVQRTLQKWDLTGAMPNEKYLREIGLLDESGHAAATPLSVNNAEALKVDAVQAMPPVIKAPILDEQSPQEGGPSPDEKLGFARELDHLYAEGKIYEIIKRIEKKDGLSGNDLRLASLRIELEKNTRTFAAEARRVEQESPKDLDAQEKAWKLAQETNPDDQEAKEALRALDHLKIRRKLESRKNESLILAEEGAQDLDLVKLDKTFVDIQVLLEEINQDPSFDDLKIAIDDAAKKISVLRTKVREELGVAATVKMGADWNRVYKQIRAYFESPKPPPVAADLDGVEKPLSEVWRQVRLGFVEWLKIKSAQYITDAQGVTETSPKYALRKFQDALDLLSDSVLTTDDAARLQNEKKLINDKIEGIKDKIEKYELAAQLVIESQSRELTPIERLKRLNKAKATYSSYPGLDIYSKSAEDDLASSFVRDASETIMNARDLAAQDRYDDAVREIDNTTADIKIAFPTIPEQSKLYAAFTQLDEEKNFVLSRRLDYDDMRKKVSEIDVYLMSYDGGKDAGALKAARALFSNIPQDSQRHHLVQAINAKLVARQGDPDNWESGENAYRSQNWEAAESAFRKISEQYPKYKEAQVFAQRARAAISTLKAREAETSRDWKLAIDSYQRALYIFDGDKTQGYEALGTDPETFTFAEESRKALERLKEVHENDKRVDEIIKNCEDLLRSIERTTQSRRQLVDRVESIPLFATVESRLQAALSKFTTTTRTERIYELLSDLRDLWGKTYVKGMQEVASQIQKNRTLIQKASHLATELENAGLLVGHEALACQLQADLLDLEFANVSKSGSDTDLQKMEENRRERLTVQRRWPIDSEHIHRHDEKIQELERTIRELVDRRAKADLERRINEALREYGTVTAMDAQAAYAKVLGEMEKDERLHSSIGATTALIRVAWKAREWSRADSLARRLRENTTTEGIDYVLLSEQWLALGKVAQAYAADQIDDGMAYAAEAILVKNTNKDLKEAKAELENETVSRLVQEAKDGVAQKSDQGYMLATQKYASAYKLAPNNPIILKGLEEAGAHISENIKNITQAATTLQLTGVTLDDLRRVCKKAKEQHSTLSDIFKVAQYLKALPKPDLENLQDSLQKLDAKRKTWDEAERALSDFERDLAAAINQPEVIDQRTNLGGWKLEHLEQRLQDARKIARQDIQLSRLVDNRYTEWIHKRDVAEKLNKLVILMMSAVGNEDFDQVIASSSQLEESWKTAQRDGFGGLEILVYEVYPTSGSVKTPQEHREMARKQKENFEIWSQWAAILRNQQKVLLDGYRDLQFRPGSWKNLSSNSRSVLIEQRFSLDAGLGLPLQEIIAQVSKGRESVATFQSHYQSQPGSKPASQKAEQEKSRISVNQDNNVDEFLDYTEALRTETEKRLADLRPLVSTLTKMVKDKEDFLKKYGKVDLKLTFEWVQKCKRLDPFNRDVANLEQRLNNLVQG